MGQGGAVSSLLGLAVARLHDAGLVRMPQTTQERRCSEITAQQHFNMQPCVLHLMRHCSSCEIQASEDGAVRLRTRQERWMRLTQEPQNRCSNNIQVHWHRMSRCMLTSCVAQRCCLAAAHFQTLCPFPTHNFLRSDCNLLHLVYQRTLRLHLEILSRGTARFTAQ